MIPFRRTLGDFRDNPRSRKPQQAAAHTYFLAYVGRMNEHDLEPRPPSPLVEKIDSALAVLILVGIAGGSFWLASGLTSSYMVLFN